MFDDIKEYMTVLDFARKFDYHPEHVRRLIRSGELEAIKLKQWRISPEAVKQFLEGRSVVKNGKKSESNINI